MTDAPRLRQHPEDRFAGPVHHFDLPATAAALRQEPHHSVGGHRQIALFRRGPLTLLVFAFEAGGALKEHQAEGTVTIQTLSGRLTVVVDEATYELPVGHLVTLAPGVRHAVLAAEASDMLLAVCRES
ncbi:cupin domain-containing protein [Gemmatimonas aurantiaca]|uniref:cupin domain-containing protein n=1 Tax=Gemmatimonas aurantiaca TaxID=173480 RepID=UPI00301D1C37